MDCTRQPNLPQKQQKCFVCNLAWSCNDPLLLVNQLCITHEITVQGSILPEQAKSWASPTSRPVVRNRLHFPWCCHSLELFDLGHCTATTMCTVILSIWLSSSSRSSFVFVTKFDKLFYHYVSGWIWFDLNIRTSSFWGQSVLMLQHIFIVSNTLFDLSYACLLRKWYGVVNCLSKYVLLIL